MIGILSDNNYLHLVKGTQVEGIENQFAWRIARSCRVFLADRLDKLGKVRFLELTLQVFLPRRLYLNVHMFMMSLQQALDRLFHILDGLRTTHDIVAAIDEEEFRHVLHIIDRQC